MNKIFTVAKGELYRYFISPAAYVYLVCFLLLNSSFALYFGGIFTSGNASLKPMFNFLPWLYLIFIPGIAMRLWAEEFKSGTVLQIMTLPVSIESFVWGKFLASWAFCSLALILTFPFIITLNVLGNPDNGIICNSYCGAFLISGAMLAISQTASALSKNQVIALVLAVILNLLFLLSGLEYILGFFRGFMPDYIIDMIASFSFLTRITDYSLGLFGLSSLIFVFSIIFLFNFFTSIIISFKTSGIASWLKTKSAFECILAVFLCLGAFVGVNLFSETVLKQFQIDFTEEQLFSPSPSTKNILKNLPSPVLARVYYSPILGERDEKMRENFQRIKLLLKTYQKLSEGKFSYHIYDPEPLSDIEDRALQAGLQGLSVPDLNIAAYFGIAFSNEAGHNSIIPFFPLERSKFLEQDLTEKIYLLQHKRKNLGLFTSLPILGEDRGSVVTQPWQITKELQKYYNIISVNSPDDLNKTDLLMIVHPQNLSKEMEDAIYNYSLSGKKILAFFDIAPEALFLSGPQTTFSTASDYGSLPEKWGFRFLDNQTVADLNNATFVSLDEADYSETTQDLVQFYVTADGFSSNLPETEGLKRLLMTSASVFAPLKESSSLFIPLLKASSQSELISSQFIIQNIHPAEILRLFKADTHQKWLAAHIISKNKNTPFNLIVVGDSDMLYDSFWAKNIKVGNNFYTVPLFDNVNFILNALDVLSETTLLTPLRGKSPKLRPYTKLEQRQKQMLREFKIKEQDIFKQINLSKKGLQEIWNKKSFEERENFTPEELSIITKIKKDLQQRRQELFAIRKNLNKKMEQAELLIKLINIYAIPFLLVCGILFFAFRKTKLKISEHLVLDHHFLWLSATCLFCLIVGFSSVFITFGNTSLNYENTPLFPNLQEKINEASHIILKTKSQTLSFEKEDSLWKLQDYPYFLINQNRIKSFLSALIQASIYEKKAEKIESLSAFGLQPLNDPDNRSTSIDIFSSSGKSLLSIDVGDYNVDLGRGTTGAYVREKNKFQVWLATMELVDLNLDYHYWAFANLWNLAFGRFATINNSSNTDYIAKIVSILLNTELSEANEPSNKSKILTLNATGENFKKLELTFYESKNRFYVQYHFEEIENNSILQSFADTMKNNFFELTQESMEKIKNASQQP